MKSFKNNSEKQDGDSFWLVIRFESNSINSFRAQRNTGSNWRIKLYEKNFLVEINFGNDIDVLVFTDLEYYKINTHKIDKKFKPGLYMQNKTFIDLIINRERMLLLLFSNLDDSTNTINLTEKIDNYSWC